MFRCYLLRNGRIVKAENLDVASLDQAIADGRCLLASQSPDRSLSGIEIWEGAVMLYSDGGQSDGGANAAHPDAPTGTAPHDPRFATVRT